LSGIDLDAMFAQICTIVEYYDNMWQ